MAMYASFIPVVIHHLNSLGRILEKAEQHCISKKIDQQVMLNLRLFPDMFALTRQVQVATDMVKAGAARLTGLEAPKLEDNETSFAELRVRIDKVVAFLTGLSAAQFEGAETREIQFSIGGRDFQFTGEIYLNQWILPNFYFHKTTAYNILRHNGVELVKRDFLS